MDGGRPNKHGRVGDGGAPLFFAISGLGLLGLVAGLVAWVAAASAGHGHGGPVRWVLGQARGRMHSDAVGGRGRLGGIAIRDQANPAAMSSAAARTWMEASSAMPAIR